MATTNTPGWSGVLPDPGGADGSTRWTGPAADYASPADGISTWTGVVGEPAVGPSVIAEGSQSRPGWLTRGRDASTGS